MDTNQTEELDLVPGGELPTQQEQAGADIPDDVLQQLVGTPSAQSGKPDSEGEPEGTPATLSLNDLAKSAGIDPDALYKATVSLPDEQGTATLEELKNLATKGRKADGLQDALTEERNEFANEKLRYMQGLEELARAIPQDAISNELRQAYQNHRAQMMGHRDQVMLTVIPDWQDAAIKDKDMEGMRGLMQEYGMAPGQLDGIEEAGGMKLVYDFYQLKTRIAKIRGNKRNPSNKAAQKPGSVGTKTADKTARAKTIASSGDKVDAIASLLTG